jgi:hypothetical protein
MYDNLYYTGIKRMRLYDYENNLITLRGAGALLSPVAGKTLSVIGSSVKADEVSPAFSRNRINENLPHLALDPPPPAFKIAPVLEFSTGFCNHAQDSSENRVITGRLFIA